MQYVSRVFISVDSDATWIRTICSHRTHTQLHTHYDGHGENKWWRNVFRALSSFLFSFFTFFSRFWMFLLIFGKYSSHIRRFISLVASMFICGNGGGSRSAPWPCSRLQGAEVTSLIFGTNFFLPWSVLLLEFLVKNFLVFPVVYLRCMCIYR